MSEDKDRLRNVIDFLKANNALAEIFKQDLEEEEYMKRILELDLDTFFTAMYNFTRVMSGTNKEKLNHLVNTIEERNKMIAELEKMIKE